MKTLTKLSLLILGLATLSFPILRAANDANADKPALRARPGILRRLAVRRQVIRKLDLSADQISQLKAKRQAVREAAKAIRQDQSLTREQKKAKLRETLQATRGEVRSTLTPDQQAKVKKFRERLKARRGLI